MTNTPWPKDVFKRPAQVGDMVAVGMSYGQSSVLRVGKIIGIKASKNAYAKPGEPPRKFSVRVRWRNNGNQSSSRWEVKDSNFIYEEGHSYAKFILLDPAEVDKYPQDIDEYRDEI